MKLTNNTILITGGTSGIGLTLGRALLIRNNTVILLGRDQSKLALAEKEGFKTILCDLGRQEDIDSAVFFIHNHYPQVNMLFNNAGVQCNYDFTSSVIQIKKISQEININLTGQLILTQLLIPILAKAPKAVIVNTTSGLGIFPKVDGLVYSAGKAAMRNFTTGLRYGLKNTSIRVLELIPPVTDTPMTKGRKTKKMSAAVLVDTILPQLQKEKEILTIPKIRLFFWIAFLFPSLAHKILSKS